MSKYGTGLQDPHYLVGVYKKKYEEALKDLQESRRRYSVAEYEYQQARNLAAQQDAEDHKNLGDAL